MTTTKLDELRCIEAQIEEAIALEQAQPVRLGEGGRYEAIHIGSVLREALVHCQLLRRMIETGRHGPQVERGREEDEAWNKRTR